MNQEIELHDSVIGGIQQRGPDLILNFSQAYLHRSEGRPGIDPGSGWICEAQVILSNGSGDYSSVSFPFDIYEGDFFVNGEKFVNFLPASLKTSAKIELHFSGNAYEDGSKNFVLKGEGCTITLTSEPVFVENFEP